jgi:hypothetical protein
MSILAPFLSRSAVRLQSALEYAGPCFDRAAVDATASWSASRGFARYRFTDGCTIDSGAAGTVFAAVAQDNCKVIFDENG